ncbi:MAG: hypothetical protein ACLU3O_06525, partial [Parasutterella sp.]|uniref:hypothetical protein n=1 Tax=Parasutterella sp. TaxID=2049037 RepID=UPI00399C36B0
KSLKAIGKNQAFYRASLSLQTQNLGLLKNFSGFKISEMRILIIPIYRQPTQKIGRTLFGENFIGP